MALLLQLLGHEVRTAGDGLAAVEVAEQFRPEVVLMDVGMPRLNGLDATRRIRAQPWGQGMTIIALTGWGQEGDRERSRAAGCDGHLVKPVNLPDLEKLLDVPFAQDGAEANGSSIALLAECEGKRCLLTGDAYPGVLMESLERLFAERGPAPLRLDAMKVSHHGSRGNTTWPLLYRVECGRYLAGLIPQCHATFYPDDAHLSVPLRHQEEIFSALVAAGWPDAPHR